MPCEKTPVTVLFAPNRKKTEDGVVQARGTASLHMSAAALQCNASGGKREVALLKFNDVVLGAPAGDAFDVGFPGVHQTG